MHPHDPNQFLYLAFYIVIISIAQARKGEAFLRLSETERTNVDYLEKGIPFQRTLAFVLSLIFFITWAASHFLHDGRTVAQIISVTVLTLLIYWFREEHLADRRLLSAGVSAHYISARRFVRYILPAMFLIVTSLGWLWQIGKLLRKT